MNCVALIGRLTKDPEFRTSNDLSIARYTLAVDRRGKDEPADFIRCVAFGKTAQFAEKYLSKGSQIGITGSIRTGSYKDKNGNTVYTTEVIVENHTFCGARTGLEGAKNSNVDKLSTTDALSGFSAINARVEEGELPFV